MINALDIARRGRRAKRASGGRVHVGPIISEVAGRTDHHPMDVPASSYVIPADIISALGEGNTLSGMKVVEAMFPEPANSEQHEPIPIAAAGGEVVLSPGQLKAKFGDDLDHAHKAMDEWVKVERKKLIKTLRRLPGPATK